MNRKSGFTLAEVLVTLMIIGVIAAMTIPSLMQSTAQQEYRAAFKKAMSMINQAVTLNYALEGRDASDYVGTSFHDLLTQRLNVLKDDTNNSALYTADGMYFKALAGENTACNANNGMESSNICGMVEVDVNGEKGPNKPTTAISSGNDLLHLS